MAQRSTRIRWNPEELRYRRWSRFIEDGAAQVALCVGQQLLFVRLKALGAGVA
jgi:hypothetical protein